MHLSDAVLESVMVFRLGAGAVAEVVVPLCLAKAGFFSGCTVYIVYQVSRTGDGVLSTAYSISLSRARIARGRSAAPLQLSHSMARDWLDLVLPDVASDT